MNVDVTKQMVDDDLADLEVWYANKLAAIKKELLAPVKAEVKRQNKAARDEYLAQRGRLRKLREAVEHQPLTVAAEEPGDGDD